MYKRLIVAAVLLFEVTQHCFAQDDYPYPLKYITLHAEQKVFRMAYMDVQLSQQSNKSKTVLLLHGKNFNGYYWKDVATYLNNKGYRVIIPDQVGWGRSDKPDLHYSFHMLAANTRQLLDSLGINNVTVIGHSMGGMLAARFTLMYPDIVERLVLEDPIGLEDYRTFVPYTPLQEQYAAEANATYESYRKYIQTYFPNWQPQYEELVQQQAAVLKEPDFKQTAWVNALTYEMIYQQPVCYELKNIRNKTLLIVGLEDRTIVGKVKLSKKSRKKHGQYQQMGKEIQLQMAHCQLTELDGVGHIPHIQDLPRFKEVLDIFLQQ